MTQKPPVTYNIAGMTKKHSNTLFVFSFAAIAFGISVVSGVVFLLTVERIHHNSTHELLQHIAELQSRKLELFIEEHEEILQWVARDAQVAEALSQQATLDEQPPIDVSHVLTVVPHLTDDFSEVFITDREGQVVDSTNEQSIGTVIDPVHLQGSTQISDITYASHLNEYVAYLPLTVVPDAADHTVGFAVASIPLDEIAEVVAIDRTIGNTGEAYLINNEGTLITPARFIIDGGVLSQQIDTVGERCTYDIALADTGYRADVLNVLADYRGEQVLAAHAPVAGTVWCIHTKVDAREVTAASTQQGMQTVAITMLVSMILAAGVGYLLGRRLEPCA